MSTVTTVKTKKAELEDQIRCMLNRFMMNHKVQVKDVEITRNQSSEVHNVNLEVHI